MSAPQIYVASEKLLADLQQWEPELATSAERVAHEVAEWWTLPHLAWFTDHGPRHSRRVAEYAEQLTQLPIREATKLRLLERYILYVAALMHDMGMQDLRGAGKPLGELGPEDFQQVRHQHADKSSERLLAEGRRFGLPDDDRLIEVVAFVARGHGTSYYRDSVKVLSTRTSVRGQEVRGPLLAALLLMADELDLHYERTSPLPDDQAELSPISLAHAFKHECVTNAEPKIQPNGDIQIHLRLSFPVTTSESTQLDIERWIVVKLQQQIGLTEEEIREGLHAQARFDRKIRVEQQMALSGTREDILPRSSGRNTSRQCT
jgi:hypothetical protein